LQHSVLQAWCGKQENVAEAQRVLLELAKNNSLATLGQYEGEVNNSSESLYVKN